MQMTFEEFKNKMITNTKETCSIIDEIIFTIKFKSTSKTTNIFNLNNIIIGYIEHNENIYSFNILNEYICDCTNFDNEFKFRYKNFLWESLLKVFATSTDIKTTINENELLFTILYKLYIINDNTKNKKEKL
jgi:hypothetical protein